MPESCLAPNPPPAGRRDPTQPTNARSEGAGQQRSLLLPNIKSSNPSFGGGGAPRAEPAENKPCRAGKGSVSRIYSSSTGAGHWGRVLHCVLYLGAVARAGKKTKKQTKSASVLIHESRRLLYIKPECPQQRGAALTAAAGVRLCWPSRTLKSLIKVTR